MIVRETSIAGCFELIPPAFGDDRGLFVKTFHEGMFREHGLNTDWKEGYYSVSRQGVLRGLHFQLPPHDHEKLVYLSAGSVLDAVLDLRQGSPSYGGHLLLELDAERGNMLYLPRGVAHGFYVTSKSATMMYQVSSVYAPQHDAGILWNSAGIGWGVDDPRLSPRDAQHPPYPDFATPFAYQPERVQ